MLAVVKPHLFIGCQIEYGHVYDNNLLTHAHNVHPIGRMLAFGYTDTMNQKGKEPSHSIN